MAHDDLVCGMVAEIAQLERQLKKVIAASRRYMEHSSPYITRGARAYKENLLDVIETAEAHLA